MTSHIALPAIAVGPELTIVHAEAHRQALLSALLSHPDGFGIDLSAVGTMDSAGVQLLVALERSLKARGQTLAITDTSAVVRDVLQVYGLTSLLGA